MGATSKMVQCAESYGTLGGITPRRAESRCRFNLQAVAPKVAAMMMLGFAAVVGVAVLSSHVGTRAELAEEQLHARGFSVADAILSATMAAEAKHEILIEQKVDKKKA